MEPRVKRIYFVNKKNKKMRNLLFKLLVVAVGLSLGSCNTSSKKAEFNSILVVCQGTMSTNGSLTKYDTKAMTAEPNFYEKSNNGASLGLLPMSLSIDYYNCWVPVGGSVMIFDPVSGRYVSRIPNLNKPADVTFVGSNKVFVSDLEQPNIKVFNSIQYTPLDTIELSSSADKLLFVGQYIYTNQWSYGKQILQIDPFTHKVVDSLEVGVQPNTLKVDQYNSLWTITDGGWPGNPVGDVAPQIVRINTVGEMKISKSWTLPKGPNYQLFTSTYKSTIYYTAGDKVYRFYVDAKELPTTPIIEIAGANISAIVEDPFTGDLYIADVTDYVSSGKVYRYNKDLKLIDTFETGPNPITFCFVQ